MTNCNRKFIFKGRTERYGTSAAVGQLQVLSGIGMYMLEKKTSDSYCQWHSKQLLQHQGFRLLILNLLSLHSQRRLYCNTQLQHEYHSIPYLITKDNQADSCYQQVRQKIFQNEDIIIKDNQKVFKTTLCTITQNPRQLKDMMKQK